MKYFTETKEPKETGMTGLRCRQSPSGHDFVENSKHKLWLKVALDAIEITHGELRPATLTSCCVSRLCTLFQLLMSRTKNVKYQTKCVAVNHRDLRYANETR